MVHLKVILDDIYVDSPTCYEIPYMLLQERVRDNSEVKFAFVNKKFSHICASAGYSSRKSFKGYVEGDIVNFAYSCLKYISEIAPQKYIHSLSTG